MRKVPATTKAVGKDRTWWDPVSKTPAMARVILLVMASGEDGDGARILFYKLPDGEEAYGAVKGACA
jgi:hypothetical protein